MVHDAFCYTCGVRGEMRGSCGEPTLLHECGVCYSKRFAETGAKGKAMLAAVWKAAKMSDRQNLSAGETALKNGLEVSKLNKMIRKRSACGWGDWNVLPFPQVLHGETEAETERDISEDELAELL